MFYIDKGEAPKDPNTTVVGALFVTYIAVIVYGSLFIS